MNRLPWRDYNSKHKCFLLEDQNSLGVGFKVLPIPCEARPEIMLTEIANSISEALKNTLPLDEENPWILQVYVQKELNLNSTYFEIKRYFSEVGSDSPLARSYLQNLEDHLDYVSRPEGIFYDSQVTNLNFRGGLLHIYAFIYRRNNSKNKNRDSNLKDITQVSRKFSSQLRACGLSIKRLDDSDFYEWMSKWFNPKNKFTNLFPEDKQKP